MSKFYLLDTRQVVGNCAMFWGINGGGYTTQLEEAGLYEENHSDRETDIPIPEDIAKAASVTHVRIERLRQFMDQRGLPMKNPHAFKAPKKARSR